MDSALHRLSKLSQQLTLNECGGQVSGTKQSISSCEDTCQKPLRVLVTGAAGQIGYALVPLIANGKMLGPNQPVILHLLEIPQAQTALEGIALELEDGSYPLLAGVVGTSDESVAFKNIDVAIFVGAFPRQKGMQRKDLLQKNAAIFAKQGKSLDQYASKNVKVLVVGNPANTNCAILQHNAPSIPKENFSALTRLDMNRARSHVAKANKTSTANVKNVIIWGNHSTTQYPDVNHATVLGKPVRSTMANDYLNGPFIETIQKRGAEVLAKRGLSSAMSAANAIADHVHDWLIGSAISGEYISMAVLSDGSYGVPKDLVFSFPVVCGGGKYKIVQGLTIDEFSKDKFKITTEELLEEKQIAFEFLGIQ